MYARNIVRAHARRGFGLVSTTPHSHDVFSVARKIAHGAGAGFLILSGAGALEQETTQEKLALAARSYDLTSGDGVAAAFFEGAFNDPIQILGAVFVFMAAGQCIARFVGLAAAMTVFFMYKQGVDLADAALWAEQLLTRFNAAFEAFVDPAIISGAD
ncbi:MAG: hypothetical protein AAGJ87_09745 [Pseudomonadota bacterium]